MQINKDNIHENRHRVDYEYKVRYYVMLTKQTAHKHEIPCMGSFMITQYLPMARCIYNVVHYKLIII